MSDLIRLVYASRANFEAAADGSGIEPTVARILLQSRRNNPPRQIGGVLYYGNGCFFQCLEGRRDAVNALSQKIMRDERHGDFQILKVNPVETRLFADWSMKYIPLEASIKELLRRHGQKEFDPYRFDDRLLDDMVELFSSLPDPASAPDQNYTDALAAARAPGFWARLKQRLFG